MSVTEVSVRDHRRRTPRAQCGGERRAVVRGGGVGVAGRQGDHRRHRGPAGSPQPANCSAVTSRAEPSSFSSCRCPGRPCPVHVQHVRRCPVQLVADRRGGRERHHPHVRVVLAGGADRGEHVAQVPLIIQQPAAAVIGGGDRDHDPQRPGQHPARPRLGLAVHADQRVQRQRAAPSGPGSASHGSPASSGGTVSPSRTG